MPLIYDISLLFFCLFACVQLKNVLKKLNLNLTKTHHFMITWGMHFHFDLQWHAAVRLCSSTDGSVPAVSDDLRPGQDRDCKWMTAVKGTQNVLWITIKSISGLIQLTRDSNEGLCCLHQIHFHTWSEAFFVLFFKDSLFLVTLSVCLSKVKYLDYWTACCWFWYRH